VLSNFRIRSIQKNDYDELAIMVGELLHEIMKKTTVNSFNYNQLETKNRAKTLVNEGKYWVFIAEEIDSTTKIGFVSLYESYALYSEGAYGTMPELYVRPDWRSKSLGKLLLDEVRIFSMHKKWHRVEVTTPSLPEFDRILNFYQNNGFEITGGRKLKTDINPAIKEYIE
jgi:GNAT superfamily N-acetyltransferase